MMNRSLTKCSNIIYTGMVDISSFSCHGNMCIPLSWLLSAPAEGRTREGETL